jgi:sortase A
MWGRLEIPEVGLAVPIVDDYDPQKLIRGVGHVPGTALPGGLGNLVLAGHRDTFFRPLRNVHPGMDINVITQHGRYRYRIDTTEIVTPDHVEVLEIGEHPEMTLITCYPFDFVGPAPKRFIVHAHLLSLEAA